MSQSRASQGTTSKESLSLASCSKIPQATVLTAGETMIWGLRWGTVPVPETKVTVSEPPVAPSPLPAAWAPSGSPREHAASAVAASAAVRPTYHFCLLSARIGPTSLVILLRSGCALRDRWGLLHPPDGGVERVVEGVADHVDGEHDDEDAQAGEECHPPCRAEVRLGVIEQRSPGGAVGVTDTEEGEPGFGEDGGAHRHRGGDNDRGDGIGQHIGPQDPQAAHPGSVGRFDISQLGDPGGFGPHDACHPGPAGEPEDRDDDEDIGSEHSCG